MPRQHPLQRCKGSNSLVRSSPARLTSDSGGGFGGAFTQLRCAYILYAASCVRNPSGMGNRERETSFRSDANQNVRRKKKKPNKKSEESTKVAACPLGKSNGTDSSTRSRSNNDTSRQQQCSKATPSKKTLHESRKVEEEESRGEARGGTLLSPASRKKRKRPRGGEVEAAPTIPSGTPKPHHPFPTEYGDHFETPLQAYRDIEGALSLLSKLLGKKRKHLRIWDPYVSSTINLQTKSMYKAVKCWVRCVHAEHHTAPAG